MAVPDGFGAVVAVGLGAAVAVGLGAAVAVGPGTAVRLGVGVHAGGLGTALAAGPGTAVSDGIGTAVADGLGSDEPDGDNTAEAIAGTAAAIRAADTPRAATRSFVRNEILLEDGGPGPHRPAPFASTHTRSLGPGCMQGSKCAVGRAAASDGTIVSNLRQLCHEYDHCAGAAR